MAERRLLSFEPRLLPQAAANMSRGIADLSLDVAFWVTAGVLEVPVMVKISESISPEVAALAFISVGAPFSMVSVVQGRRFMERYFGIPSKFGCR